MLTAPTLNKRDRGPLMRRIRELRDANKSINVDSREIKDLLELAQMPASEARQADRDLRKVLKFKDEISHANMARALARLRANPDSADEPRKFSHLQERRGQYDSLLLKYPGLFPADEKTWFDPRTKPPAPKPPRAVKPTTKPDENAPSFDYGSLVLGGEPLFAVENINGSILGCTKLGPMVTRSAAVATAYCERSKKLLAVHRITMNAQYVESLVNRFQDDPKYLSEGELEDMPEDFELLYSIVPELKKQSRNEPTPLPDLTVPTDNKEPW